MDKQVAIVGGGVIGGGWAARFLLNGWDVRVFDLDPQAERKTQMVLDNARRALPGLTNVAMPLEGKLTHCKTIAEAVTDCALIVEAVPERLEVKHAVYAEIEAANVSGIIASSTSGIMPSDLQSELMHPERLIVAHPFNPVYLLPLVELVAGEKTDAAHIEKAKDLYSSIGMHPLHCRVEIEGFLSDRLQEALWREALWLLKDEVATAQELDAAIAYGPGLRWAQMGTMQTFHLAGGEGGMRAMLAMFGPCLKWPWTKLMDVPELTDDFVEMVGDQCDTQSGELSPRDLERVRDKNLVGIIRSLRGSDWGAGATVKAHDRTLAALNDMDASIDDVDVSKPITTGQRTVPLDWTDYNGHMNEARYLNAFGDCTDRFMKLIGCDADYVATGGSYFTAETHIRYIDEVHAGARIDIKTQLILGEGKKMHLWHEMFEGERLIATGEHMLIHVSLETRKPSDPGAVIEANLTRIADGHRALERPAAAGSSVGVRK